MWGHPLKAGVLADLPPPPLDVDDLMPGAVSGGEDGVVLVGRGELAAHSQQLGGERREHDGSLARYDQTGVVATSYARVTHCLECAALEVVG